MGTIYSSLKANANIDDVGSGRAAARSEPIHLLKLDGRGQTTQRYQVHFWIGSKEYNFLKAQARAQDEPMARIVRRLIRQLRVAAEKTGQLPE